ncbi:GntR family transcriptional regulator [Thiotrichales bacterium 19S3-7]|nr:GntR family transcriptional regulator [Thiotrichales bacterium 19S3-7]MCF6800878.1 GntR family transcriptional regulator [Thiotrichales bacterium 19S3-11]
MKWQHDKPIYLQIKEIIIASILDETIKEKELLPSVRQLSLDYQINPLTVSKAYQLLLEDGIIEKLRGLGMQVKLNAKSQLLITEKAYFLNTKWPMIKKEIQRLNLTIEELGL